MALVAALLGGKLISICTWSGITFIFSMIIWLSCAVCRKISFTSLISFSVMKVL